MCVLRWCGYLRCPAACKVHLRHQTRGFLLRLHPSDILQFAFVFVFEFTFTFTLFVMFTCLCAPGVSETHQTTMQSIARPSVLPELVTAGPGWAVRIKSGL